MSITVAQPRARVAIGRLGRSRWSRTPTSSSPRPARRIRPHPRKRAAKRCARGRSVRCSSSTSPSRATADPEVAAIAGVERGRRRRPARRGRRDARTAPRSDPAGRGDHRRARRALPPMVSGARRGAGDQLARQRAEHDSRRASWSGCSRAAPSSTERERMLITGMSLTIISKLLHNAVTKIRDKAIVESCRSADARARCSHELFDLEPSAPKRRSDAARQGLAGWRGARRSGPSHAQGQARDRELRRAGLRCAGVAQRSSTSRRPTASASTSASAPARTRSRRPRSPR